MTLHNTYDVVIIGGAMLGSSVAWFTANNPDFAGRILVIERDPTYEFASTSHTNSCIRQQFSNPINIQVSQFGVECIKNFRSLMGGNTRAPDIRLHSFGYMYLADSADFAETLKAGQKVQAANGAGTMHLTPDQIAARYPFYNLDDILAANHNTTDEGYFDGAAMFDSFKRNARDMGVEYIHDTVTGITRDGDRIASVTLQSGAVISCGTLVNCAGPRGGHVAAMAGLMLPVEPRKRFTFLFSAATPLDRDLPLTIDPSGVHVRTDGANYMAGCAPLDDHPVDFDDFAMDHDLWESHVWPILAHRIPQFEAIKLQTAWAGHYAYNALDQNAVLGPHPDVSNFMFANGFSGHGLQQAPAMGRGMSELLTYGQFRTLDLSSFAYDRILRDAAFVEHAVI